MKLIIDKNRKVYSAGTWGTKNENNYEILDFEFPAELEEYNKRIVYYLGDERVWDTIVNNKAYITNAITKYEKVNAYVWLTKNETITLKYVCDGTEEGNYYFTYDNVNYYFTMPEVEENDELIFDVATSTLKLDNTTIATTSIGAGTELTFETIIDAEEDFRTQLFEMQFYENENADGIVPTPEQVDGFNTMLTAMNEKIEEINELETTIENAETQRQGNEETRQENESTRQDNEQTRQEQEADRERRTDEAIADIQDKTAEYNANAEEKTNEFNDLVETQKLVIENYADTQLNAIGKKGKQALSSITTTTQYALQNISLAQQTGVSAVETASSEATTNFNTNATNKTNAFNSNATEKTTAFDNNASSKTSDFNTNAESKTNTFNDNATQKTTDFNNNAQAKTDAFDEHTAEITADIEELQQEVEELSQNMPWNETEQATEIDITDAAKYSKNHLEVFGNTEQASYEGKNLFSGTTYQNNVVIQNNGTINYNTNYNVYQTEVQAETQYTISITSTDDTYNRDCRIVAYTSDGTYIQAITTFTTNKATTSTKTFTTPANTGLIRYHVQKLSKDVQLEEGSTATDYEPYVGGVPAPSPDYPQPIHVVTGNNTIEVQGENLIFNNLTNQTINGVTFVVNPDKSITINGTASATTQINLLTNTIGEADEITLPAGTYTLQGCPIGGSSSTYKLDITNNGSAVITDYGNNVYKRTFEESWAFDRARIVIQSGTTVNNLTFKPMLVKGNTNVPYQPYVEPQNYPINLGSIELCKIGDYQDYLYKENGNWYKYGAINKLALTENANIFSVPYGVNSYGLFVPSNSFMRTISDKIIVISNKYKGIAYDDRINEISNSIYEADRQDMIHFRNTQFETVEDFITNNIGTILYVVLKTPTITQITDTTLIFQLDAIYEHLKLVKGTNNITVTAEDLAPYMQLTYMQDLPSKLDNLDSRLSLLE